MRPPFVTALGRQPRAQREACGPALQPRRPAFFSRRRQRAPASVVGSALAFGAPATRRRSRPVAARRPAGCAKRRRGERQVSPRPRRRGLRVRRVWRRSLQASAGRGPQAGRGGRGCVGGGAWGRGTAPGASTLPVRRGKGRRAREHPSSRRRVVAAPACAGGVDAPCGGLQEGRLFRGGSAVASGGGGAFARSHSLGRVGASARDGSPGRSSCQGAAPVSGSHQ